MTRHDLHRPQFHFSARKNWINDPNGLIWFDGEYHLFYQYNPFGDQWGHMSWGHAVSTDLVAWEELPVTIAQDERVSIYSGSVVVDWHNSSALGDGAIDAANSGTRPPLEAVYTGCLRVPEGGQAQELAHSHDGGRTWTKYAGNPVLTGPVRDFRDPKVFWHEATSRWVMVVVLPDFRCAQFFGSADLKAWSLLSEFEAPFEGQGIWECPDLIPAGLPNEPNTWLFKVDTLAGHPAGGSGARIFLGHFDGTRFVAEAETAPRWADHGADFYAALSWANLTMQTDGRDARPHKPVWIAWMNNHRYAKDLPTSPWRGAMSLPRELTVRRVAGGGWQLLQQPVPALARWRGAVQTLAAFSLHNQTRDVPLVQSSAQGSADSDGHALDIEVQINGCDASACGLRLRVGAGVGAAEATVVGYDAVRAVVFVDRSESGFVPPGDTQFAQRHEVPVAAPTPDQPLRLRVLLDACLLEVFVGDFEAEGQAVISLQIFPSPSSGGVQLFADNGSSHWGELRLWPMAAAALRY
jgi:fructan beta-fructosidase